MQSFTEVTDSGEDTLNSAINMHESGEDTLYSNGTGESKGKKSTDSGDDLYSFIPRLSKYSNSKSGDNDFSSTGAG